MGTAWLSLANCFSESQNDDDRSGRMARLLEVCSGEGLLACAKQLWVVDWQKWAGDRKCKFLL